MKRFFKAFALFIVTPIFMISVCLLILWYKPELILTPPRVTQIFERHLGQYFTQMPQQIHLKINPNGIFGKQIIFSLNEFCLKNPEGCFEKAHIEFKFRFVKLTQIEVEEIGPLTVINRSLTFHEQPEATNQSEDQNSTFDLAKFVSLRNDLVVKEIQIEAPRVVFEGNDPIVLGLNLRGNASQFIAEAHATTPSGLDARASINTSFSLDHPNAIQVKVLAQENWKVKGVFEGEIFWRKLEGELRGNLEIQKLIPIVRRLTVKNIKVTRKEVLKLSSEIEASLQPSIQFQERDSALPNVLFTTDINGKFNAIEMKDHFAYEILIGPLAQKGIELFVKTDGKIPYPENTAHRYGINHALVKIKIPRFESLVKSLKMTSSAIPAPFSSLKGGVEFQAGNSDASIQNDSLPLLLQTRLSSHEQAINTQSQGILKFDPKSKKIKLDGESKIELIRFTLPDFDLLTPQPSIAGDSRIISQKKYEQQIKSNTEKPKVVQKSGSSIFDIHWKVTTAQSGIHVFYPALEPYAPLEIQWQFENNENSGEVKLLPFSVHYMSRKAKLEHLRYYLNPKDQVAHYTGKLVIPKTDYTLFVNVFDQSGKPKIEFSSEPPLSQEDIISVLLFNQTTSELTPDESGSVANTQAAITNRALGLFSIWALSSTPIEAVNFNPSTRVYSARVKLANGLTASIGTNWENTQEVALRKRLGRNFVLSASVQTDRETNSETKKTLLEWFRRF